MSILDTIIIGGGPAGTTAAIYTKRLNLNTMIIKKDNGVLENIGYVENYYGFINPILGKELVGNGIKQAKRLGCHIISDEVIEVTKDAKFFEIKTILKTYTTKTVVLAMGIKKNKLKIKNLDKFLGNGVSYCAICDGFFFKNKNIVVIGSGYYAINEINILKNIVNKIYVIDIDNNKSILDFQSEKITIIKKNIKEISGDNFIEKIIFEDNTTLLEISGIFIAQGHMSSNELAIKLGINVSEKNNCIIVDQKMQTNINGMFAVGDCTGSPYQISKAVYEGMIAAFNINKYIQKLS